MTFSPFGKTFDFKENRLYSNESQNQFNTLNKFKRIHPNKNNVLKYTTVTGIVGFEK